MEITQTTGKAYSSDTVELDLEPNEEHIVILRRTEGSCTYGLSRITRNRELTDQEYRLKAMNSEKTFEFGDNNAHFKLFNGANAACFYFENWDT